MRSNKFLFDKDPFQKVASATTLSVNIKISTCFTPFSFTYSSNTFSKKQPEKRDEETKKKQQEKFDDVVLKGYISRQVAVVSYTHFFSVLKEEDIWMVYNGLVSGLNVVIWVPHFLLPTVDSLLRAVELGTWIGDLDIGSVFSTLM